MPVEPHDWPDRPYDRPVEPYDHLRPARREATGVESDARETERREPGAGERGETGATGCDSGETSADAPDATVRPPGVYRVVGADDDRVTLLRVADGDGRRVRSGRTERVPRGDLSAFEPAPNPDAGGVIRAVAGFADGLVWTVREVAARVRRLLG